MQSEFDEKLHLTPAMTLMRTIEQIKAEIKDIFGFMPPFFALAQTPQVLESLWQQTPSAYLNNPLSALP
ncbi:MAG: hypothetical protein PUP92_25345 [Rhizonema sp. PD38]|nr:hypothetical protein [Rhizonema sp. PD38]